MPIFPILEIESLVQESDKTRLDAAKSFVSGTTVITGLTVTPSAGVTPIEITAEGYLDWQYEFTLDIVTGENDKIDFNEGGAALVATLTSGEYTLAELCTEIKTQLEVAGALTYTVTLSATNEITIAATGDFSLLPVSGANTITSVLPEIGFSADTVAASASQEGEAIETIEKSITLLVENEDGDQEITRSIYVVSEVADRLFSSDAGLRKHEPDVMKYLTDGRATFKREHRRAQELALAWLDTQGFVDDLGAKITLARIQDTEEVTQWATMITLRLIFEGVSNAIDDIFAIKAERYTALEKFYRDRARLRLDRNQDGVVSPSESVDTANARVMRR